MGGKASRNKGASGEREVAKILQAALGIDICRTPRSGAWEHAKGDLYGVPRFNVEVKRQERVSIDTWYAQSEGDATDDEIPLVIYRKSRDKWKVVLSLDDFIEIMKSHINISDPDWTHAASYHKGARSERKDWMKPPRPDLAPKNLEELRDRIDRQIEEHQADYEALGD